MKLRAVLLVAIWLPVFAGSATPEDEKAVLAAEKLYASAMVKADTATLDKLLADDLSYSHSNAMIETKADLLKGLSSGKSVYTGVEFTSTTVRQYGDVVITNHNMIFRHPASVNNVFATMVWQKQGGGWKLITRQATLLAK